MDYTILIPVLIAFVISMGLSPFMIPYLRKLKVGQMVRDDGPQSHLKKSGTPTMGGIIILSSVVITALIYVRDYPRVIPILFMTLGFGLVGFCDDYIKVVLKRSMGLRAWQKLLLQILITSIFAYYIVHIAGIELVMRIPFCGGKYIDAGILSIPILFVAVLGTVNGSNFTDGLDGLASSVTVIIASFFSVVAIGMQSGIEPITLAVIGALLGFLLFNVYPAKIFMGDTGSLALGGFVVATAYMLQMPLYILIVAFIYLLEVVSVMLQVGYFKMSGGKRIFKMAPIHHHFELCGWSETRVVAVFTIATALLCLIGLMAL